MRIDSAILSNAIITASVENPIVSGSSQVNITNTTGYSTFSSSIQTYTDAKVAGLVDSAPGTLNTLNELAAALGDDANMSASFATTLGTKLPTATHTAFSSSNASALRTEYSGADTTLSASVDAHLDANISSLSASAHTRREEISASLDATIDALDSLGISTDTERGALSSSAHTQRVALNSAQTTANNTLSSSIATALRAEITSGDAAFLTSASIGATINDNAVKLSGIESGATADQSDSEIKTAYENNSDTNAFTDALLSKLNAIEASADVTDTANVTSAGALMSSSLGATINDNAVKLSGIEAGATADQTDEEIQDIVGAMVTGNTESGITVTYQDGDGTIDFSVASQTDENFTTADHAKLDGIEAGADVTDATNVTAAGALMDSEVTNLAQVKAFDSSDYATAAQGALADSAQQPPSEGAFANGDKTKLDGIEASADVTDTTNVTAAGALMDSEVTNLAAVKALNQGLTTTSDVTFADLLVTGDLTVQGTRTELQVATLNVEDLNITVASGSADSAAADGAGITIAGADESLTWDHGNSRFNFSDDLNVVGNITVSGNVDGRDVATDGSKLDGIESGATADQTAAEIKTLVGNASDSNVFTDALLSKLNAIEASADVTDATNVTAAGALMDSELTSIADVKALDQSVISGADPTFGTANMSDASNKRFMTDAQETKLDSVESNADVTDATNVAAAGALMSSSLGATINDNAVKLSGIEAGATQDQTAAEIRTLVGTGNNGVIPSAGSAGEFLKHDGTFGTPSYTTNTDTVDMGDGFKIASSDGTDQFTVTENEEIRFAGSGATTVSFDASTQKVTISSTDNNTQATRDSLSIDTNDNVAFEGLMIGQASGATANTIRCVGDIVAYYSDDRLKNKIGNLEDALSKVNSLNGFTYTPNEAALALGVDQDEVRVGVSAQEVQAVLPEAVKDAPVENTEGYLTVQYEKIVPLLVEAIKELSAKVEELSK